MTDPTTVVAHLIGEAEEDDLVKKVAQVAIDASRRYFKPGDCFTRATGDSTEIIKAGMEALKRIDPAMENRVRASYADVFKKLNRQAHRRDFEIFDEFAFETLDNILNGYCLPFTYVGSDEGGDFGCWPSYDGLQEAVHDGTVKKAENTPASAIQTMVLEPEVEYVWQITDTAYTQHWALFNAKTKQQIWNTSEPSR
jgi:hypothetical protein